MSHAEHLMFKVSKHSYIVFFKSGKFSKVNTDKDKYVYFLDYTSYALIAASFVLLFFNLFEVSAALFVAASVAILSSYYFNKLYITRLVLALATSESGKKVSKVIARQRVRAYQLTVVMDDSSTYSFTSSVKFFLQLYKMLTANKIPVEAKK